jgi:putative membrane protein
MKRVLITLAILALGCVLGPEGLKAQAAVRHKAGGGQQAAGEPKSERMFVTRASNDGLFEVQLGQLAQQKGSSQEVKNLGQMMVTDHQKANQQLQQLAQSKNIPVSTTPDQAVQGRLQKLQGLSGTEFDRAFLEQVVKDHRRDIAAFEKQSKHGTDADVKSFATNTLPTLRQHLQMAEQALAAMPKAGGHTGRHGVAQRGGTTSGGASSSGTR